MKTLQITYYSLLVYLRDKQSLLLMLLLPIVLILILGTALQAAFTPGNIGVTKVAFYNQDVGEMGQRFEDFLTADKVKEMLAVTPVATQEEGINLVREGKVTALIQLNANYSALIQKGETAPVNIFFPPVDSFRQPIVKNIVGSFISSGNTVSAFLHLGDTDLQMTRREIIQDMPLTTEGATPKAMDFYAVTMLVMIILYGANYAAVGLGENIHEPVGKRRKIAPVKNYQIYAGETLAVVLTVFMQGVVLILFTKYAYQANWGENIFVPILVVFVLTLFATGLGTMLCVVFKNTTSASVALNIIVPATTFIAGGYMPLELPGRFLPLLRNISPNHFAQKAIFDYVHSGNIEKIISPLTILLSMTLFVFLIALLAGRRREQ